MNRLSTGLAAAVAGVTMACSSSSGTTADAPTGSPSPDAMLGGGPDAGTGLGTFTPPTDPGAKGILFTVSGETLANTGYDFPPAGDDAVFFVDGWEVRYDRVLVTFDHITLAENPDKSPSDQSQVGTTVAQVDGPWAVDLHQGGPLADKDGNANSAVGIAALKGKNKGTTGEFDSTMRYAFSFDGVVASASAKNVNLDAAGLADYQEMISKGYTSLFVGTATWKGGTSCTVTDATYDFTKLPPVVNFRLGFKAPASYVNAQNPDNDPAEPLAGEEHQRGIKITDNASTIAQVTFHLDHAFWEAFEHDSPAHFDQFAAHYVGATGVPTAKMEDFVGVGFTPVKDKNGKTVPWRWCKEAPTPQPTGGLSFDTGSVPVNPTGTSATSIRDFNDYTLYNHSTWGHLNADGLSFVKRGYPSPL